MDKSFIEGEVVFFCGKPCIVAKMLESGDYSIILPSNNLIVSHNELIEPPEQFKQTMWDLFKMYC